jgi:hypothetical protein
MEMLAVIRQATKRATKTVKIFLIFPQSSKLKVSEWKHPIGNPETVGIPPFKSLPPNAGVPGPANLPVDSKSEMENRPCWFVVDWYDHHKANRFSLSRKKVLEFQNYECYSMNGGDGNGK